MNIRLENTRSDSVLQFLQEAYVHLGNDQQELARLRRETYVYSYGSIIAPMALALITKKPKEAVVDSLLFLGFPALISKLPVGLQKVVTIALSIYNFHRHSASSIGTLLLGTIITKVIQQIPCQEDNRMIRDEINAFLLLLVDIGLPHTRVMQNADRAIQGAIDRFRFHRPNTLPQSSVSSSQKKAEPVVFDINNNDTNSIKLNDHDPVSPSEAAKVVLDRADSKSGSNSHLMATHCGWAARSPIDQEWAIHQKALKISGAVYDDILPKNFASCKSLSFNGVLSGLKVQGYQDTQSGIVFLAFKGTTDYRDVASDILLTITGKPPTATHSLVKAIKTWQSNHPGTQIILTGHSLGASLASYVSEKTQLPAIVFENPGIRGNHYTLKNVISYQSRSNAINQMSQYISDNGGERAQYGHKIRLPFPSGVERIISGVPLLGGIFSHTMDYLFEAFNKHKADRKGRGLGPCGQETYQYHLAEPSLQTAVAAKI